ncbi:hypothetical protein BKA62DRAFT_719054 [Auriculariales sp. MPI-PUGE-AT-0066]|nr:hypothetical protein BKA62DRAFT_719054 [Auriculariales sp. MPI-PUGE-AT-0066]
MPSAEERSRTPWRRSVRANRSWLWLLAPFSLLYLVLHSSPVSWSVKWEKVPLRPGSRRTTHVLKPDIGLLEMNNSISEVRHPLVELIERAERLWEGKLATQSTTLREAYNEYIRRYKRKPPKGFDAFQWSRKRDVQLLDEFDQIHADLELFWGVDPKELRKVQQELEHYADTFTIGKNSAGDNVTVLTHNIIGNEEWGFYSADLQIEALSGISSRIPPFHATWTVHDGARYFYSWERKEAARQAAAAGTYVKMVTTKIQTPGWAMACSPDAPIHRSNHTRPLFEDVVGYQSSVPKSFIADLRASMDPCSSPDLIPLSTLADRRIEPRPDWKFVPQFGPSKTLLHSDILGVPLLESTDEAPDTISWANKSDQRMVWRGRTTGCGDSATWDIWRRSARLRLVELANLKNGTVPVLLPPLGDNSVTETRELELSALNELFDVGIPEICDRIEATYTMKGYVFPEQDKRYKYVLDVTWSSRFRRLMARNSLVFKSTMYPEWWLDRAMPWVHFVPVKYDYSDLYDTFVFFRGLPDGSIAGQDRLGERIATAGRDWVNKFWGPDDITAYTWRLYLEWVRLCSENRTAMDFVLGKDDPLP